MADEVVKTQDEQKTTEGHPEVVSKAEFDKIFADAELVKAELNKMRSEQESAKIAEQEKKGNLKEVVDQLRKEKADLELTMKSKEARIQAQMLHSQLRDAFLTEGCHKEYVDDAIKLLPSNLLKAIQIGEGYKANVDDVKRAVTTMKNQKQLFFNREVKVNDDRASAGKMMTTAQGGKKSDVYRQAIIASKQGR